MDLGSLFNKTYLEYRKNFRQIFFLMLVLVGIPLLFSNLVFLIMGLNDSAFYAAPLDGKFENLSVGIVALVVLVSLIIFILYTILETGLVKDSIKGKFDLKKTINSGKNFFWNFVWFNIVILFFLALLFLALIIPGIIFTIYWSLAVYVYFDSDKTVLESLRSSFKMVRGNWWKVFGYTIILLVAMALVGFIVGFIIGIPSSAILIIFGNKSLAALFFNYLLKDIANLISTMISLPFMILFYKNIYLELKKKR